MHTPWQCNLLGVPQLTSPQGTSHPLERKAAALLALLAQEGPTSRGQLIHLLWPDTREAAARNNLVHLLRKLKTLTGEELVHGADVLQLNPGLQLDVLVATERFTQGKYTDFLNVANPFLHSLHYDDCPELEDWVTAERDRWTEWHSQALLSEAQELENQGDYQGAVVSVRDLLDLDPLSETAYCQLMRLYYLMGQRHRALENFERFRKLLQQELGVSPLPETLDLVRQIEQARLPLPPQAQKHSIPLTVMRPPHLVGREREWQQMEEAWSRGQMVFLRGDAGVGKSRLARDFALSRGVSVVFEGRPGDLDLPYSSAARAMRTLLEARPGLTLEPWVRQQLSRILPEFHDASPTSPRGAEDLVRFHEAVRQLMVQACEGVACCLLDDLQFYDEASRAQGLYILSTAYPLGQPGGIPGFIQCYRKNELPSEVEQALEDLVQAGMAVTIDIEPLRPEATLTLLEQVGLQHQPLQQRLVRFSGGNPLYLLETVKHLLETQGLEAAQDAPFSPPPRVSQLLERRLKRLSNPALQAARAAAVLQNDFDLELVAEVLHAPLMDFLGSWEELEQAQMVRGNRFSHDLIYESVLGDTPRSILQLLHRSAARARERHQDHPARIAEHHLQGGDPAQAGVWFWKAAEQASFTFGLNASARHYLKAAEAFEAAGKHEDAFEALVKRAEMLGNLNELGPWEEAIKRVFQSAKGPYETAKAWRYQAELLFTRHRGQESLQAAQTGLEVLQQAGLQPTSSKEIELLAELHGCMGVALWVQERIPEAASEVRQAIEMLEPLGETPTLANHTGNLGVILDHLEMHREAAIHHRRASELHTRGGDLASVSTTLHNLAVCLADQGLIREAQQASLRAQQVETQADGTPRASALGHAIIAQNHTDLAEYDLALERYRLAEENGQPGMWHLGAFEMFRAEVHMELHLLDQAEQALQKALATPGMPGQYRSRAHVNLGQLRALQGQDPTPHFQQAEALLERSARPLAYARLWLAQAPHLPPEQGLQLALQALQVARQNELGGVEVAALTRQAQALLPLDRKEEAREAMQQAWQLLQTYTPARISTSEVLLTLLLVQQENPEEPVLTHARQWLQHTLQHVPEAHRSHFLQHNPVVRQLQALLQQSATQVGERNPVP